MAASSKNLRRINQNIPSSLYERLEQAACREDRTKSAVLVRALEAYLGRSSDPNDSPQGNSPTQQPANRNSSERTCDSQADNPGREDR